jgi:ribosomal protein S4
MFLKIRQGRNYRKFKLSHQTRIDVRRSPGILYKLKRKKWYFLKFKNQFQLFPRIGKINKIRFFYKNSLNIRRILRADTCFIKGSTLYKLYLKARRGNPRYLHLINLFESRLDVCLFRLGIFRTSLSLRQFILHKNVYLNGQCVNKPGIHLKPDDIVQINFLNLDLKNYHQQVGQSLEHLSHLEIDLETFSFIYLGPFSISDKFITQYKDSSLLNYIFRF